LNEIQILRNRIVPVGIKLDSKKHIVK